MPNGGGVLFGCFLCQYFVKGQENPLIGKCGKHNVDTNMSFICNDMVFHEITTGNKIYRWFLALQRKQLVKGKTRNFEPNILYFYSEVSGFGYPPPIEIVPFASLDECKIMTEITRKQFLNIAHDKALQQYQSRLKK